jgi:RloB-like protein
MGKDNLFWLKKKGKLTRESNLIREYQNSLLIICEGEQTEPNYFEGFLTSGVKIKVIGKGKNTLSLVKDAIKIWKEYIRNGIYFENLWCVFDKDDFPLQNYNQAFETISVESDKLNSFYKKRVGRNISINIAYSNEAFELWYLLHFDYHTSSYCRHQYTDMLNKRLKKPYKKNDPNMYNILHELSINTEEKQGQKFAIKNAQKLYIKAGNVTPQKVNPSTSVHLLVLELNNHLKK